jgi:hypothetical protein
MRGMDGVLGSLGSDHHSTVRAGDLSYDKHKGLQCLKTKVRRLQATNLHATRTRWGLWARTHLGRDDSADACVVFVELGAGVAQLVLELLHLAGKEKR